MQLSSAIPTREELYAFARTNQGATLKTLHKSRPFGFEVAGERMRFFPSSEEPRNVAENDVDKVLANLQRTGSLQPETYSDDSFNASYLLPLVLAWRAGSIEAYEQTLFRTPADTLSGEQKEAVFWKVHAAVRHRAAARQPDFDSKDANRIKHGFEIDAKTPKSPWVGSVYWSDNLAGNDVEIAFDLSGLSHSGGERSAMTRWFQATSRGLLGKEARNHSGKKHEIWFRSGFSYDRALEFFDSLGVNLNPMTPRATQWVARSQADNPVVAMEASDLRPEASESPELQSSVKSGLAGEELNETSNSSETDALKGTLDHMLKQADRASQQSGQETMTIRKTKHNHFEDPDFRHYLVELLENQEYRCGITNLPLQLHGSHDDAEMLASLDRIDSSGHYEPGNLQVVCRFVNRWKGADDDDTFRRLLKLLKS